MTISQWRLRKKFRLWRTSFSRALRDALVSLDEVDVMVMF